MKTKPQHVMMMAAGTGGHVFPALAVAKQLQQHGVQVSWLATPTGMENRLLKNQDIPIYQIDIQGVRGNGVVRKLLAPFKILKATLSAMRYMKQLNIDAVVGFGGYVAGPGGLAARALGIPVIIHEQNAIAGFTNTQLSRIAKTVCQAFPNTFPESAKIVTTGNPVRKEITEILNPSWRYQERAQSRDAYTDFNCRWLFRCSSIKSNCSRSIETIGCADAGISSMWSRPQRCDASTLW